MTTKLMKCLQKYLIILTLLSTHIWIRQEILGQELEENEEEGRNKIHFFKIRKTCKYYNLVERKRIVH